MLKTAFFWKKMYFQLKKQEYVDRRRKVSTDMEKYNTEVKNMYLFEENLFKDILNQIYAKLGITDEIFNMSLQVYNDEHSEEIKWLSKMTEESMQNLKEQYLGIKEQPVPEMPNDQFRLFKLLLIDIRWKQQDELNEIPDENQREMAM